VCFLATAYYWDPRLKLVFAGKRHVYQLIHGIYPTYLVDYGIITDIPDGEAYYGWALSTPLPSPRALVHNPGDAGQEDLGHTVGQGSPRAARGPAADRGRGQPLGSVQLRVLSLFGGGSACTVRDNHPRWLQQKHTRLAWYMHARPCTASCVYLRTCNLLCLSAASRLSALY